MIKIVTQQSDDGTIICWESLWEEIKIIDGRVSFYYGVLPLYQERGQPLRKKTWDCSFEEFLSGDSDDKVEMSFGRKTTDEIRQSILKIGATNS